MRLGKSAYIVQAVRYLTADGVVVVEGYLGGYALLDGLNDEAEFIERLGRLRVQIDVASEVDAIYLSNTLDNDGAAIRLAYKSQYLGMTLLAIDDDLLGLIRRGYVFLFNALLDVEHYRAGGVNELDALLVCGLICLGGLAMSTEEYAYIMQLSELLVVDSDKSQFAQSLTLHTIVHDVAQTVEWGTLL